MAKDPAVLFYTSDFLSSTITWENEEIGAYIKALCIQHNQSGLSESDLIKLVGDYPRVREKFVLYPDGRYYNERMLEETEKRKRYTASCRLNGNKGGRPKNQSVNPSDNQSVNQQGNPLGNENENINNNDIVIDNSLGIEEIRECEREEEKRLIGEIITYLNSKLGTRYKASADYINKHIRARLAEGFTYEDFCTVIDKKYNEWSGTEMAKFLRPETLFGTKFMTYLNQPDVPVKPKTAIGANGVEYYVGASDLDDVIPG